MEHDNYLKMEFEELLDKYEQVNGDAEALDDLYFEAREYFLEFLEAGFDPDEIAMLMAPEDILAHYQELTRSGATIDIDSIVSQLPPF